MNKKAQQQATDFLMEQLSASTWKHGQRLPTTLWLAQKAGVSKNTMSHALAILKQNGTFTARQGAGIYYGPMPVRAPLTKDSAAKEPKERLIYKKITRDIIENNFNTSEFLPSYKEMSHRYGTSYQTLDRALRQLVIDERIVPFKRRFRAIRHTAHISSNTLVLVLGTDFFSQLEHSYLRSLFYIFIHYLEKECSFRNLHLVREIFTTRLRDTSRFKNAVGFIVWQDDSLFMKMPELLRSILCYERPIIIYGSGLKEGIQQSEHVHLFRNFDWKAGYQVGKYLIDTGHRKMCYLAQTIHSHRETWVADRYEGLKAAIASAGMESTALVPLFYPHIENISHKAVSTQSMVNAKKLVEHDQRQLIKESKRIKSMITDTFAGNQVCNRMLEMNYLLGFRYLPNDIFKEAAHIPNATAWVLENDSLAIYGAVDFLRREQIKVPRDISLVGFDNSIESFYFDLTTYDFNIPAALGTTFEILLGPGKKQRGPKNRIHDMEGFLVLRGSTMAPRKKR